MEVAENLKRVNPCFQIAALVPEQTSAHAGRGEKLPRASGTGQFKVASLSETWNAKDQEYG
jgi:hypothetical protein